MPYADKEQQREWLRQKQAEYRKSPAFREKEAERKRLWYEANRKKPKKKKAKAKTYTEKYQESKKFRTLEAERKRLWYEANRDKVIARVIERREALQSAKAKAKKTQKR